ncbi:MAG: serine/threonine-protein kinase [Prosthecobacter sp.]|uniref:serine/threonine-protein kinase n=1 Tax=Prosthecobacter sp. TaxID=1965333 RepID=UPI0038FDE91A
MQPVKDQGGDAIKFEPFTPPSTAELDALIPGYTFLEFIDCGGMGAVYKALQKSLNRTVAVKLLPQVHRNKESFAERFKREAHALAQLNHPHIIAVHDFGETQEGQMYYAMEFVAGMDLQQLLKRAPPGPKQIFKIVTQVCEALQFAHERGIVHRDIKPANILIDERGNVKVADFGLVKIVGPEADGYTATGATLGTPDYIAPEALDQSSKIDHRADIYSLGVMIYELLTGHVPKGAWEPPSTCSGSDKRMDAVVNRAMQNDPDKRYQQVSEMTQVLEKLLVNSDNWKNYRRPEKSNISVAGDPVGPISTGAVTVKLKHGKLPAKHTPIWATATVLLLGVGFSAAWQAGWLSKPEVMASVSVPPPPQPAPAASEQLNLARWVMEHGGVVNVLTPTGTEKQQGGYADIHFAHELPAGPITVWRVSFLEAPITDLGAFEELVALIRAAGTVSNLNLHGLAVPTDALKHLADIPTLTSLDLMSSPAVTLEAVPLLAACTQLKLLRVGDAAVIEQLRPLLPECGIHDDE